MSGVFGGPSEWVQIVERIGVPLASGCVGVILTASLAVRRFRSELHWRRRAEAYEKLTDALFDYQNGLQWTIWKYETTFDEAVGRKQERIELLKRGRNQVAGQLQSGIFCFRIEHTDRSASLRQNSATSKRNIVERTSIRRVLKNWW